LDKKALGEMEKDEVEVLIDEEKAIFIRLSQQGRTELSHVFTKKGEHKMRAILRRGFRNAPWKAELELRVVDYEEEIIRLYDKFLGKLANYDIVTKDEMTAREIQSLVLRTEGFDADALDKLTTCFENAEYSCHLVNREDYEIMYLSLKEFDINFK
jgi:hypothetical protein